MPAPYRLPGHYDRGATSRLSHTLTVNTSGFGRFSVGPPPALCAAVWRCSGREDDSRRVREKGSIHRSWLVRPQEGHLQREDLQGDPRVEPGENRGEGRHPRAQVPLGPGRGEGPGPAPARRRELL